MRFALIRAESAKHSVPALCRMLRVSRSGYYAWLRREAGQDHTWETIGKNRTRMMLRNRGEARVLEDCSALHGGGDASGEPE